MPTDAKTILESLATAIMLTDGQYKIIYANTSAEQLFGMSRSKLRSLKLTDLINRHEKNLMENLSRALKANFQGFSASDIAVGIDPSHTISVDMSISQYSGKNKGLIVEIKSINYQQKLSYERQRRTQHLAARDLIRNLAHEIKNPLGGIRGAAQLLEMTFGKAADITDYTKVIIEQSDRLKTLVDNLLGPQRPNPMSLANIHYVVEKVLSLETMATKDKVRFEKDYDPSLPELMLDVDAMQQTFINIISNAIQALTESNTERPLIKIKTRAVNGVVINGFKYPTSICVAITDNGPGIPESIMPKIFYPMVTSRSKGNGLGLSIAQSIVERHSGTIECESQKGKTTFSVILPLKKDVFKSEEI